MHFPRRVCSVAGAVCVVLCCLLYVADYYDFYYTRTAALPHRPDHAQPSALALTRPRANHTPPHRPEKKRRCKKKKCRRLQEYYDAADEGWGRDWGDDEPLDLTNATAKGTSHPVWSEFADRGYTIVGTNGSAMRRLPHVLIIGVKKAGTRALLEFLRVHPSIRTAGPEVHFFDRFYSRGLAWYRSQMPLSLEGQMTVEKTPAYFTTPVVPSRVSRDLPGVRLLLVVREPVTRALSDYTQGLSKRTVSCKSFDEMAFVNVSTGLVNSNWGPISSGLYSRHLQHWFNHFPRSAIHIVNGENLVHDPAEELSKVQEFLGLRKVITDKHFFFNATKGFPCLVKRERSGKPHCLGSSKGRAHPVVSQATIEVLKDFYRPFNFKFYKMVGHNFQW